MDKKTILATLKNIRENSPKRNFKQSIDLIINLKDIDLKKTDHQINMFVTLHYSNGKKKSICAFVGPELEKSAKEVCDEVILADQFDRFKGKKELKKLASKHDFFISQANIMPKVATTFGRFLGPKGKMPNPKIGAVLPPNANVKPLQEKLTKTINLVTKNEPVIKCVIGKDGSSDEELIDNALTIYNSLIQRLPNEKNNIKNIILKYTMGPCFKIGEEVKIPKEEKSQQKKESKSVPQEKTKEKTSEAKKDTKKKESSKKEVKDTPKKK